MRSKAQAHGLKRDALVIVLGVGLAGIYLLTPATSTGQTADELPPPPATTPAVDPADPAAVVAATQPTTDATVRTANADAPSLPPGSAARDLHETDDIRQALADYVNAAMTRQNFAAVRDRFVDEDRERFGPLEKSNNDQYDGRLQQIRQAWQGKYKHDFNLPAKALDHWVIVEGEITDAAVIRKGWPVQAIKATDEQPASPANTAGDEMGPGDELKTPDITKANPDDLDNTKKNLDKGRNVALVRAAGGEAMPPVIVSMVHELPDSWVIDVPNAVTGTGLVADLGTRLAELGDHAADWPDDEGAAYRIVAHTVLMATYEGPMKEKPATRNAKSTTQKAKPATQKPNASTQAAK